MAAFSGIPNTFWLCLGPMRGVVKLLVSTSTFKLTQEAIFRLQNFQNLHWSRFSKLRILKKESRSTSPWHLCARRIALKARLGWGPLTQDFLQRPASVPLALSRRL